jgi:site-specific DNA-methyltransferase (adenine-specific)
MPISEVYNEDCLVGMSRYPDKYFDLAIIDPPYGIGASDYKRGGTQRGNSAAICNVYARKDWDERKPTMAFFLELVRVSKNQIIWGANHFISAFPHDSSGWIVWDKMTAPGSGYADCELAWTSFKKAVRQTRIQWSGMLQYNIKNKEERLHPTQKPIALYNWLLKNYAKPGDKILDTHLGSGSSRIAAYKMGFDFFGWEIDKDYFEAQEKRFKEAIAQPLFDQPIIEQGKLYTGTEAYFGPVEPES